MTKELIYAFDFGTGSLGEAVRKDDFIIYKTSLLVDGPVGNISEQRKRRRAFRTREAHKSREKSLSEMCAEVGIPVLAYDDERMLREFPRKGDETCYTSCLLRIKLFRGEKLEGWQVYKALHSAIQRRGYAKVPWDKSSGKSKSNEEKKFDQSLEEFEKEFNRLPDNCKYLCYFDAWKMGLWTPEEKDAFRLRIDCHAERARNWIIRREPVLKELRALLQAAERFYPKLQGRHDDILFGKGGKEYASYYSDCRKKHGLRRGAESDWKGIMGQKVPRFDNRIIGKCVLMPRRNVCRADDGLVQQVRFLLQLKNMRFERDGHDDMLSPNEMDNLLQSALVKEKKKSTKAGPFKLTPTQWKKYLLSIGGTPKSAEDKVDPPKTKGRARFCRPAMRLIRQLLTSNITPSELHERCSRDIREDTLRLNMDDIAFLKDMPQTWESFYIPDCKMDALLEHAGGNANRAIVNLISEQIDPVVRHRLFFFYEELQRLQNEYGTPDKVALEFVRDDFMGKKAKQKYDIFLKKRKKNNDEARKELEKYDYDAKSSKNLLKMKLLKEQDGKCFYMGESLSERELDSYDIDHIVPRSQGGSDSYLNYTLTKAHTNRKDKKDQTPYDWLKSGTEWEAYLNRIDKAKISKKKETPSRC